jgi:AraC-like DNA-binding protein
VQDPETPPRRAIDASERSGVVHPENLARYAATWIEPAREVAEVVDRYWTVRWRMEPAEVIPQRILTLPAVTLSIEAGDVPAPLVVTGVHRVAWQRDIAGWGEVFAIRLRPAGLAVLSDLEPAAIADATLPVTSALDARLHSLLVQVAAVAGDEQRARAADRAIAERLARHPLRPDGRIANAALDELTHAVRSRVGSELTQRLGRSERSIQRALKSTLGQGPKWVARWVRLQEVTRVLSLDTAADMARLAAELGYADQSHLLNDFRDAVGMTPGAYLRSMRALQSTNR